MTVETLNFVLGAITALIIPFINFLYKLINKRNELRKVKSMIFEEYIDPLSILTNKLDLKREDRYKIEIARITNRMDYLLENEIKYMSSENQFEIIRMIEYTKSYLYHVDKILIGYSFQSVSTVSTEDDMIEKRLEIKKLTQRYKDTIDEYRKLKTDNLIK